jgi:hypothetical protein
MMHRGHVVGAFLKDNLPERRGENVPPQRLYRMLYAIIIYSQKVKPRAHLKK